MKKAPVIVVLLGMAFTAEAQKVTYLTLEAGPQWSLIRVADQGGYFQAANVNSSIAGLTLGQEVARGLSLVTGIYYQPYKDGINMIDDRPGTTRWSSYTAVLVPLRAEYRVQFTEFPVSLTPRIGYLFGTLSVPGSPDDRSMILSSPDGTPWGIDMQHTYGSGRLHMIEVGAGLNLRFHGVWQASLNLSYLSGFTDPLSATLDYSDPGGNNHTATYSTKGNTLYTTLAFNIPVSNIWQLRDYRIRARIENSVGAGKPTDRKGQFYAGGEAGSLWRQFNLSRPAVGARPMEGRGLFRYANLHAGGYFGYMIREELGIDIGINYQRSSTFYALMYDHAVDFTVREPAPMFLEVPVRIRYFYNLRKEKLYYVVCGGASVLVQFAGENYNQGGGDFSYISPVTGTAVNTTTSYTALRTGNVRPAIRVGTGVEYSLPTRLLLIATLYVNYMHGFMAADEIRVTNALPEIPSVSSVSYNGSGWSLDLGIKMPFRFRDQAFGIRPQKAE